MPEFDLTGWVATFTELFPRKVARSRDGIVLNEIYVSQLFKDNVLMINTDPYIVNMLLPTIGSLHPSFEEQFRLTQLEVKPQDGGTDCIVTTQWETMPTQACAPIFLNTYAPNFNNVPYYDLGSTTGPRETWAFDLMAQNQKITSVRTSSYVTHYPSSKSTGNAIGVNGNKVDGVDVLRGRMMMTCSKIWNYLSPAALLLIKQLSPSVNSTTFCGFAPGTVLFQGAKISMTQNKDIQIDYNFQVEFWDGTAKQFELNDGTSVSVICAPWDYMWFVHAESVTAGTTQSKHGIESVHVSKVYEYYDLTQLGLVGPFGS